MNTENPDPPEIDRTGWNPDPAKTYPWDGEPDRVQWRTAAGRPGLIVRSPNTGALCGYVAVDPGHPLHGADYDEAPEEIHAASHSGLTYAGECSGHICHVPEPGEPGAVWWLGFDCGHAWDYSPGSSALMRAARMPTRTVEERRELLVDGATRATLHMALNTFTEASHPPPSRWVADYFDQLNGPMPMVYRDVAYVRAQVEELAAAVATYAPTSA